MESIISRMKYIRLFILFFRSQAYSSGRPVAVFLRNHVIFKKQHLNNHLFSVIPLRLPKGLSIHPLSADGIDIQFMPRFLPKRPIWNIIRSRRSVSTVNLHNAGHDDSFTCQQALSCSKSRKAVYHAAHGVRQQALYKILV